MQCNFALNIGPEIRQVNCVITRKLCLIVTFVDSSIGNELKDIFAASAVFGKKSVPLKVLDTNFIT